MDPGLQDEFCRNFTQGNQAAHVFYSPRHPGLYPAGIKCSRTITTDYGYFVRIDFRNFFRIEPPSNEGKCDYDYLEIRDGSEGYSTLIGKFCGSDFPPMITSSGRSLWLRFVSDGTIEYDGFQAVYNFIPNPLESLPFIPKCEFSVSGATGFIGTANISEEHVRHATKYHTPVDCTWIITSEENLKIYIQFHEYQLNVSTAPSRGSSTVDCSLCSCSSPMIAISTSSKYLTRRQTWSTRRKSSVDPLPRPSLVNPTHSTSDTLLTGRGLARNTQQCSLH